MRIEQQVILLEHFHEVQEELDLPRGRRQVLTRKRATVLAALVVFSRRSEGFYYSVCTFGRISCSIRLTRHIEEKLFRPVIKIKRGENFILH